MPFYYFLKKKSLCSLLSCLLIFICSSVIGEVFPNPSLKEGSRKETGIKSQIVKAISEKIDPNMGKIWEAFLSNFEQDKIESWNYSEKTGLFSINLKNPLKLWIPASKTEVKEPRPGSILIFGVNNKVTGRLIPEQKKIEFTQGFKIYCKYKMGLFTVPLLVEVYSFTYKNEMQIILEAGKAGVAEKRSKPLEKYLSAWGDKDRVVQGDYEIFLNQQR